MKGDYSSDSDENYDDENEEIEAIKYFNFIKNTMSELTSLEKMFLLHESFIKLSKNKIPKNGFENWLSINLSFPNSNRTCSIEDLLSIKYQKLVNNFLKENLTNIEVQNKIINFNENLNDNKYIDENEDEDYNDIFRNHSILEILKFKFEQFCNMLKTCWNNLFSEEK